MIAREIRFTAPMPPRGQLTLFAQSLDDIVPEDAPVRALAALLDGVDWSPFEERYDGIGQPPIHPKYMAGAILYGLMHGFLSSRDLESMSRKHVDFLWLMEGFTPDHSTFCKFRDRHEAAVKDLHKYIARPVLARRSAPLLELLLDGTRLWRIVPRTACARRPLSRRPSRPRSSEFRLPPRAGDAQPQT